MMTTLENNYNNLLALIKRRQDNEKNRPYAPYSLHPTTINYRDIDGNTLLHYAAALGDEDKLAYCFNEKADINAKNYADQAPIRKALQHHHVAIADELYRRGAQCDKLEITECQLESTKTWFKEVAAVALNDAFPRPEIELNKPGKINPFFTSKSGAYEALALACKIGDITFLNNAATYQTEKFNEILNKVPDEGDSDFLTLLRVAIQSRQLETVRWLIEHGAPVNPTHYYTGSVLVDAISDATDYALIDLLLDNGANVNSYNHMKQAAIHLATDLGDIALIKKLISKGASVTDKDFIGCNLYHYAASAGHVEVLVFLQSILAKTYLDGEDIYGFRPLDYALMYKNDAVIKHLQPEWDDAFIHSYPRYGVPATKIGQYQLQNRFRYFIQMQYGDEKFLNRNGCCNGFVFIEEWYAGINREDEYFICAEKITQWDGCEEKLRTAFPTNENLLVNSLLDLLNYWISIVNFFQANKLNKMLFPENPLSQNDRARQFNIIYPPMQSPDNEINTLHDIYKFETNQIFPNIVIKRSFTSVRDVLNHVFRLPAGMHFEIESLNHVTSGHVNADKSVSWFDSNAAYRMTLCRSPATLIERIINRVYIYLGQYRNMIHFALHVYYFEHSKPDMQHFRLFNNAEFPSNQAEADVLTAKSPLTHLHWATIFQSKAEVEAILSSSYFNVLAKDELGLTPVDYALLSGNQEIIHRLLNVIHYDLQGCNQAAIYALNQNKMDLVNSIINLPNLIGFEELLKTATTEGYIDLVNQLVSQHKARQPEAEADKTSSPRMRGI